MINNVFFWIACYIGVYLVIKFICSMVDIGFKIYEYIHDHLRKGGEKALSDPGENKK